MPKHKAIGTVELKNANCIKCFFDNDIKAIENCIDKQCRAYKVQKRRLSTTPR